MHQKDYEYDAGGSACNRVGEASKGTEHAAGFDHYPSKSKVERWEYGYGMVQSENFEG